MINTVNIAEAPRKPNPHGVVAKKLHDSAEAQIMHLTLGPGQSLRRHITPVDVCFYVSAGEGVVEIGDEKKQVAAGTLVESPAGVPHRWINNSGRDLEVLVIKTPRPSEPTKML